MALPVSLFCVSGEGRLTDPRPAIPENHVPATTCFPEANLPSPTRHRKAFQGFKMFHCENQVLSPIPAETEVTGHLSSLLLGTLLDLSSSPYLMLSIKIRLD